MKTNPAEVTLMDDDLHPYDLKYSKRHPEAKVGADGTANGDKGYAK